MFCTGIDTDEEASRVETGGKLGQGKYIREVNDSV